MQLSSSFSGSVSSKSSSYVGRSLQLPASYVWRLPASCRNYVVGARSEKADFWQLLGGRGLPGGEQILNNESKRQAYFDGLKEAQQQEKKVPSETESEKIATALEDAAPSMEGFGKEMMGLTGGFPGGEMGLNQFIATSVATLKPPGTQPPPQHPPRAPPPPLLMPGMTVIVKNSRNPFYMYSGIVQRVSDGRVGVLFEGGNWDKLLTFYLEELERTPTGPPMTNPKSAILLERPAAR